jgi:hypothetical protein
VQSKGLFALVLDRFLVPFCSKILVACMRTNFILKSLKIRFEKLVLTARGGQSCPDRWTVRHTLEKIVRRHGCLWWE